MFSVAMRAFILISAGLAWACTAPTQRTAGEPAVTTATIVEPVVAAPTVAAPTVAEPTVAEPTAELLEPSYPEDYPKVAEASVFRGNPGLTQLSARFARMSLGDDTWDPIADQDGFGIEFSRESPRHDFGWEVGAIRYMDDERDSLGRIESELTEVYLGARRTFGRADSVWRPHLGGGLSYMMAEVENLAGVSDDDESLALYAHAGLSAFVTRHLALGLDVRGLLLSKIRIFGENLDADYMQIALTLGWSF